MSERRVWVAQCLCPQRHCVLATAGLADDEREADKEVLWPLRIHIAAMIAAGAINPWCGLCKSPIETCRYEIGRTPYHSMGEAAPFLRQSEREQAAVRALWGDMKRSD